MGSDNPALMPPLFLFLPEIHFHFFMLHVSHWTNNRLSKSQNIAPFCVSCKLIERIDKVEDVKHTFVDCIIARGLYDHLTRYFDLIEVDNFSTSNLIFGRVDISNPKKEHLFNFLIILAHRAIWQTRNKIKRQNQGLDIKSYFEKVLVTELRKLSICLSPKIFVKYFAGPSGLVDYRGGGFFVR